MSHFTNIKTSLQNLFYLEKALNRLQISYSREKPLSESLNSSKILYSVNLVIPQSNSHDILFSWNGTEYELIVDMSFWKQSCPVENFIDKVSQQYAGEIIIGEGAKTGFQPVKYQKNIDGSNTLVLERWHKVTLS
jgi:Protein of unknown function (DUF1257)